MSVAKLLTALLAGAGVAQLARLAVPGRYRSLYEAAGARYGVDPNMLHALAIHESRENAGAVNRANANGTADFGVMQINSTNLTALGLTEQTAMDPARSVDAAARLIRDTKRANPHLGILDEFAVYNAGFSSQRDSAGRRRPKLTADGTYINQAYVQSVASWFLLVTAASFAPVKTIGWNA